MKKILLLPILIFSLQNIFSQDYFRTGSYLFLNEKDVYYKDINTLIKPLLGAENELTDSLIFKYPKGTKKNLFLRKLLEEHLFQFQKEKFTTFIDPIVDFRINYDKHRNKISYLNTRGFNIIGNLMSKVFFNTSFYENQGKFASYIDDFYNVYRTLPGYGRIKITNDSVFDFAMVYGSISFRPIKQLNFTIGYDRLFVGDGYRSMILYDFTAPYPFFKINTTLGKFDFTTIVAKTIYPYEYYHSTTLQNSKYPSKLLSYNFLTYSFLKDKLKFSIFDAMSINNNSKNYGFFAVNYFTPIIRDIAFNHYLDFLYQQYGLNITYNNSKIGVFYGQFVLNSSITSLNSEYTQKLSNSIQIGYKSFDFFNIKNLFFQTEFNRAESFTNEDYFFSNQTQSLIHPVNTNFYELLAIISYSYKRFEIISKINYLIIPERPITERPIFIPDVSDISDANYFYYGNVYGTAGSKIMNFDMQIIYNVNKAYNLQCFAGINLRKDKFKDIFNTFVNFGVRTAIRFNKYDF
ncbi:MAG: hypothetical protein LBV69_03835 [Bacteroidales bacterium]|jgi:hypothetical protein|nr:hypothetical protein [Bacteroidales bacterium]